MASAEPPAPDLSEALGAAILGSLPPSDEEQDHLAIVRRSAQAEQEVRRLLGQAVSAARASGHSWAALGSELGMSRQAAQQRFGTMPGAGGPDELEGGPHGTVEERWLGPVTAFDEMAELALAGRLGWRTVGAGMLRHRVRRTSTQWEHRRVVWVGATSRYEQDGWEVAVRAFPWVYLVRDTGRPAGEAPGPTLSEGP
ncbi:hypothetical protein I601_1392 [Nocardioides dokdonensis FR1436]|uniref:Uncharacterized protein n=1 Tax=Nocardioides dokdonensis FR1436 TaxID=1300347 RepID=A0A1A9GK18_9ACTN|nr:hypothetical protein [Nocardioides dokdonensis]ANH37831.1 hypothetical protein I601_1392 [Nocardioides dokdonensis FR1436]